MNREISEQIRHGIEHALTLLDRDPFSRTAGCFDRLYWGWKLKDFPDATLQRLVYPLVRYYYGVEKGLCDEAVFMSWIVRVFGHIRRVQHTDGSFDQAFPQEHSHGAAAFLLFDMARTYQIIRDRLDEKTRSEAFETMRRTGDYLATREEEHGFISNHLAGAAAALHALFQVTGEPGYRERAEYYVHTVISRQSPEGWYVEYGGADPGYQTLAIYYLADYYFATGEKTVLESLRKAVDFVSYCTHPDGSFGGEYGSRNTEVFYPGGFARLQKDIPLAGSVLGFMMEKIGAGNTVNLNTVDTGNLAPLLSNYLEAAGYAGEKSGPDREDIPFRRKPFIKDFRDAGIVVYNGEKDYAVVGVSKGGVIKEFDKISGKKRRDDCGYIGRLKTGRVVSTQYCGGNEYALESETVRMRVPLYEVRQFLPDPLKFLLVRLFTLTFGRVRWFREGMKKAAVRALISGSKKTGQELIRTVSFGSPLKIEDRFEPEISRADFESWEHGIKFSTIHMASAKYYYRQ